MPGTSASEASDLAVKASWVSLDRGVDGDGYRPKLTVKFLEGAPRDVPLAVHAALTRTDAAAGADARVFDVHAGELRLDAPMVDESVFALPAFVGNEAAKLEDGDYVYELDVAGRALSLPFFARRATREAIAHADRALLAIDLLPTAPLWLREGTIESVQNLRDRLAHLVDHGDADADAQKLEAQELDDAASALDHGTDPYERRTGPARRAYRSPADDSLQELGLYVPPGYDPSSKRRWPLIVALHGLNGRPMAMLRWFFGGDVRGKDQDWEERHWTVQREPGHKPVAAPNEAPLPPGPPLADPYDPLPSLDAFVVTPGGHGNAMYRDLGEDDVLRVLDWVRRVYPIDPDRITITGPSMGGIGTASVAFRHPDLFAAAEPLCGYHSYFVRRDILGHPLRPWERLLAEERSNVAWAENGENLPLWIVHGTQDLPESNSGVLIERYDQLGYAMKHEHPDLGHNVWQTTYLGMKGAKWLLSHARVGHPRHVHFRTVRLRDGDDAWVHLSELAAPDAWGEVEASVASRTSVSVKTRGVQALGLDRDPVLFDPAGSLATTIDGTRLVFAPGEPILAHRDAGAWAKGGAAHDGLYKHGEITGPIREAFHAPLLFVYGVDDPGQTRANEEVARAWATIRWGTTVKYPVLSDAEFFARGEPLANDHALFLVGNAKSNRVVRALEPELPIAIDGDPVVLSETAGGARVGLHQTRIAGPQLGAAFVRPNPRRPDRYLVVVEGVDALGTWRSLSLPDLLPDFIVWDERIASSRGADASRVGYGARGRLLRKRLVAPRRDGRSAREPRATRREVGVRRDVVSSVATRGLAVGATGAGRAARASRSRLLKRRFPRRSRSSANVPAPADVRARGVAARSACTLGGRPPARRRALVVAAITPRGPAPRASAPIARDVVRATPRRAAAVARR